MPGDTKPHKARAAKNRRKIRKTGSLEDAQRKLWQAMTSAEDVLLDPQADAQTVLKAVHAISQASGTYAKLKEVGELQGQLDDLAAAVEALRPAPLP